MIFQCRNCGDTSADIDKVLDGACECGCAHFRLASETPLQLPKNLTQKETIRRDLHYWLDLNIDSMDPNDMENIRVLFEIERKEPKA